MSSECASQQEHYYPAEATCRRLHLQTSLLRGKVSEKVPPEEMEQYHPANVFTVAHGCLPSYPPYRRFSSIREWKNLFVIHSWTWHMTSWQVRAEGPWSIKRAPGIPGLTYHPGHCDDCSFFSPKCSGMCGSGWLASSWQLGFAGLVQIELHQVSSKDGSLTGGKKVSQLRTWH